VSRIVNREYRIGGSAERAEYRRRAGEALRRTDWTPLASCFMSNHVHWALRAGNAPSDSFVRPLHAPFARWLNHRQARIGPVFAGRHRTIVVPDEAAVRLIAYVHNNPVRAGAVSDPADSDWSSHRFYIGEATPPPWLDIEQGLALCGCESTSSGRLAFHELVRARALEPRDGQLAGDGIEEVRRRVRRAARLPAEISDAHLTSDERSRFEIFVRPSLRPAAEAVSAEAVLAATAAVTGISVEHMGSSWRRRDVVRARRTALLAWVRRFGQPQAALAGALGISSSACSQLLADQAQLAEVALAAEAVMQRVRVVSKET
jgi:hypothetical protein